VKWVYATFCQGDKIKPHMCHPFCHRARMAYLWETYGAIPTKTERLSNMHVDFGGMISTKDPVVEISLAGERTFSCWEHQIGGVLQVLECASPLVHGPRTFYKFARWPGVLCFISKTDRRTVLRHLMQVVDREFEGEHAARMHEGLVQANVATGTPEKDVRRILRGPNPNN